MNNRLLHRVVPFEHENIYGFLIRIGERNRVSSTARLIEYITGNRNAVFRYDDIPRLAYYCRNSVDEISQLSGIELLKKDGERQWRICGEWITQPVFTQVRKARVCPQCLAEDAYWRGEWALSFYTICAHHGIPLTDRCPGCGRSLKWNRQHVAECSCGSSIKQGARQVDNPYSLFLSKLLSRQISDIRHYLPIAIPAQQLEWLARLNRNSLCKVIWFFGHCLSELGSFGAGHGRRKPTAIDLEIMVEKTLQFFCRWPDRFGACLEELAMRTPSASAATLLERLFGAVQHYVYEVMTEPELAFVQYAFEQYIHLIWRVKFKQNFEQKHVRQFELDI